MSGVAACLRSRNDLAGAEALQRQLVELARRHEGPDSEAALGAENSLAMTLGGAERYAESAAVFRHIVAGDSAAGRAATPDALTHRYNLAVDLVRSGDWPGARQVFTALLPEARQVLGADHPRVALVHRWYAWLLDEAGSPGAAAGELAECRRIQTAAFGADDPQLGWTRALGARIEAHAGDGRGAESEARAALAVLERTLGAGNSATGFGWEALAHALLAAGRPAEARTAAERAVALRRGFKLRGRTLAAALDLAAGTRPAAPATRRRRSLSARRRSRSGPRAPPPIRRRRRGPAFISPPPGSTAASARRPAGCSLPRAQTSSQPSSRAPPSSPWRRRSPSALRFRQRPDTDLRSAGMSAFRPVLG